MKTDEPKEFKGDITKAILPLRLALEATGLSKVGFLNIVKAGWIKRYAPGQYLLVDVARGMSAYYARPRETDEKRKARNNLIEMRTRQIEADIARNAASLIDRDLAIATIRKIIDAYRETVHEVFSVLDLPAPEKKRLMQAVASIAERVEARTALRFKQLVGGTLYDDDTDDE
jgi:hypothetical protein